MNNLEFIKECQEKVFSGERISAEDAKKQLGGTDAPINVVATMNAGFIPADHWVQHIQGNNLVWYLRG